MSVQHAYPGALPPPSGVAANIIDPDNHLSAVWTAAEIICLTLPTVFTILRFYVKMHLLKRVTKTDHLFLLTWVLFVILPALGLSLLRYGVGLHAWDVPPQKFSDFAQIINIQQTVYMPAICLVKIVILLQYLSIFCPAKKSGRWWLIMVLIGANAVFFTILMFIEIFECVPRQKIWNPLIKGSCLNIQQTFVATAVINVCDDFIILILPIFWVFKLKSPLQKRIGISIVFCTGLFACICSIMRLIESIKNVDSPDITHDLVPVSLWAIAEVASGMIICSMPYLPRLFNRPANGTQSPGLMSSYWYGKTIVRTANSKRSRKRYSEMDEYPLDTALSNTLSGNGENVIKNDIETGQGQGVADTNGASRFDGGILKAVSIQQSVT